MTFMASIIDWLNTISSYFYDLYVEVLSWPDPFWRVYAPFYFLSTTFSSLAWQFYYFSDWVNDVDYRVSQILDWGTIWSYILSYVPNLVDIRDWFYGWQTAVGGEISGWWYTTQNMVIGWISDVQTWTTAQLNNLQAAFLTLISDVETWATTQINNAKSAILAIIGDLETWTITEVNTIRDLLARLIDWPAFTSWITSWWNDRLLDIQGLIDSAFLARDSLWAGWQDWRDQVAEFFTDPEDWLYKSVDRIVERFW